MQGYYFALLPSRVTLLIHKHNKGIKNIAIDTELVLSMYNVHPYFSLKNLGKNVHMKHGKIQRLGMGGVLPFPSLRKQRSNQGRKRVREDTEATQSIPSLPQLLWCHLESQGSSPFLLCSLHEYELPFHHPSRWPTVQTGEEVTAHPLPPI